MFFSFTQRAQRTDPHRVGDSIDDEVYQPTSNYQTFKGKIKYLESEEIVMKLIIKKPI